MLFRSQRHDAERLERTRQQFEQVREQGPAPRQVVALLVEGEQRQRIEAEPDRSAQRAMREVFDEVRVLRPEGTRRVSTEVFLVGLGRKPRG